MARAGLGPGWDCLFANDFDEKKAATYRLNWGSNGLHVGDVAGVSTSLIEGQADLAWASFPCQDLSLAGAGAGLAGKRSGTFWPFWRLMTALIGEGRKPRSIVLENVCGLLTSNNGQDFAAVCDAVADAGYWIGAVVADAAMFIPQSRPRLFIFALDQSEPVAGRIQSLVPNLVWHPERLCMAQSQLGSRSKSNWLWLDPPVPAPRNLQLSDVVEDNAADVNWHNVADTARLLDMMSPVNRAKVELMARNTKRAVGCIYKRTRLEGGTKKQRAEVRFDVAGCLRTPGGGSSRQTIIVVDNGNVRTRLITPRETARLMGLPDSYALPNRYNEAYHLTGDGVVVPVVRHLIKHIIEPNLALTRSKYRVAGQ